MFRFASYSVAKRLGFLTVSAVLGLIILLSYFMISERSMLQQERQSSVRQAVEVAHGMVAHYHDLSTKGKMSEDEAKQAAMAALRTLRYSGSEYFWINDMQPKMVMHPIKPELEGKDLAENKDPTGKPLFVAFVDVVKAKGAGDVPYLWPKPGSDKPVLKVSHVKGFAPWGWIIGSGVYVDTVDSAILGRAMQSGIAALVLAVVLLGVGVLITRSIVHQLGGEPGVANAITHRMAQGELNVEIPPWIQPVDATSWLNRSAGVS
jgi:methyl-accepting chemotaxis protein